MLDPWNRRAHPVKYLKKFGYWLLVERLTLESAEGVIFTSRQECSLAQGYFPTSNWKSIVVGNGISEPPHVSHGRVAEFRRRHGIDQDSEIWLYLSRIHPKKGIEILLEALSSGRVSTESVTLAIAGDGSPEYLRRLKTTATSLGLDTRIRWLGPLYGERKWEAFASAQLFVLPSHQENFGIAVVEALAMSIPVCTTTAVNIHEDIESSKAGLICKDDTEGLIEALRRWQALSSADRAVMSMNARRCFEEKFRIDGASSRLLETIRGVVEASRTQWRSAS